MKKFLLLMLFCTFYSNAYDFLKNLEGKIEKQQKLIAVKNKKSSTAEKITFSQQSSSL